MTVPGLSRANSLNAALLMIMLSTAPAGALSIGPIPASPVATLYLVGDGEPATATVTVVAGPDAPPPRLLLRAFDAEERLSLWRYVEHTTPEVVAGVESADGIDLRSREGWQGGEVLSVNVPIGAEGVHQVRLVAGTGDLSLSIDLPRDLQWGWSAQNGSFTPWEGLPSTLNAWVPPNAEQLRIYAGAARILGDRGAVLASIEDGPTTVAVDRTEVLWRFEMPDDDWSFSAADFPLILCPTAEAARAIRASVEVLPDGTVVAHKFQRRIAEMLPEILADYVGDTEELIVPLSEQREAWLADPLRSLVLMNAYLPAVEDHLRSQNLDPESHWGGSLDGWQQFVDRPGREGRWDRPGKIGGLRAGASSDYDAAADHLALAALEDDPTNPYFGREELLYRAAAAALRDLMRVSESEVWPNIGGDTTYPGMMAFALGSKTLPVYGRAAPHLQSEIRDLWTEGARRLVDRSYPDGLVSCRNQSSHYLVSHQAFADGSEDPLYEAMARLYAHRWVAGQHPSGYHMEAVGPDSSYIGMTHWHEAVYYRMGGAQTVLDSMRRSYELFNHTVGPEPDGRMLGGFNFNHRVGEGFYGEQWGGAKGIAHADLPEVGLWADDPPTEEEIAEARDRINAFLDDPQMPRYPKMATWRYLAWGEPDRSGTWPCEEPESFIRTFEDEFIFVRRPAYYAAVYVGMPVSEYYIRSREKLREPYPDDGESTGAEYTDIKTITPFGGGGLTGVWTADYGHSLMAANWAPTTHHGLIATDADGQRWWEDYHAHSHVLDQQAGTLTITGRVEGQPIAYERRYVFGDDAIEVELTLAADEAVTLQRLAECVPVARGGWKARGAELQAAGATEGAARADRFTVSDAEGAGVAFELDSERDLLLVPEGLQTSGWRQLQIGRVEIALPATLAAGERISLTYTIRPLED
ncbi:MAG: hypothetical protein R6V07_04995 [Armatimonadota bacterium]